MRVRIVPHIFSGTVQIPASKSHTIRRLIMASLTAGTSRIENPLDSLDGRSCVSACRILGAEIEESRTAGGARTGGCSSAGSGKISAYTVRGSAPGTDIVRERFPVIDVGNSGTTLFLGIAAASLFSVPVTFTGDEQIARRGAAPLLDGLRELGVTVESKNGCIPITVRGPWKGGTARVSCPTSQYLSALLIASPLAPAGVVTNLEVPLLNEKPYIEMTLSYIKAQGLCGTGGIGRSSKAPHVEYTADFSRFRISGGASYTAINGPVPGDFSSAAFPAAAAIISGGKVTLLGLDGKDTQGDKVFFEYLSRMGCDVIWHPGGLTVSAPGPLRGGIFDLNATPDMLPVMAALGAHTGGTTELVNAAHARIKETDRIAVMAAELGKLGVSCAEKPDGLVIHGAAHSPPGEREHGGGQDSVKLSGHGDHRVVMALACAALGADRPVEIESAEAAEVTYPGFLDLLGGT
ncbi:MAG: 3-phosphoshikimate 1-carboxyvinyltransferase [Treponema sp.]|nr:3-phosphoshikimate 1-carboxyvinyltransferase [Treponema sp.]